MCTASCLTSFVVVACSMEKEHDASICESLSSTTLRLNGDCFAVSSFVFLHVDQVGCVYSFHEVDQSNLRPCLEQYPSFLNASKRQSRSSPSSPRVFSLSARSFSVQQHPIVSYASRGRRTVYTHSCQCQLRTCLCEVHCK